LDYSTFQNVARTRVPGITALALIAIVMVAISPLPLAAQEASTPEATAAVVLEEAPAKPEKFDRVYDVANRLNKTQFDRFHFDIGRMWNDGFPAMIYIRRSPATEAESRYFADQLRQKWDIESSSGADDGIVLLVTIRNTFPHTAVLSVSYGANAFPSGQMTEQLLHEILADEAYPRIRVGNVNGGLTYALRRILYYTEYTAPFPPELTASQERANTLALPISILIAAVIAVVTILPRNRLPHPFRQRTRLALGVAAALAAAISLAISVYGRADIPTWISLFSVVLTGALLWQMGRMMQSHQPQRVLRARTGRKRQTRRARLQGSVHRV
jgi:uncharacterized membrane protein YgcG